jgi:carbon-monoxide dehydrogenase medium subunit
MRQFTYLTPKTLDEAISLLESHGERAKYIAGGTDVLVKIKEGKVAPDYLISLKHIIGQDRPFLNHETGELYIGAFCTHRSIEQSPLIQHRYPIIHDAVKNIGSVQIRNVATIGGNLVNAVPSADGAIPLIALDARVNIYGTKGQRSMDLKRFFLGPGQCDLEDGEILTEIVIPALAPRTGNAGGRGFAESRGRHGYVCESAGLSGCCGAYAFQGSGSRKTPQGKSRRRNQSG